MSCTSQCVFCCILHNFAFGGKSVTPPYGPREHVTPHVWTDQSNSAATQDEIEDEAEVFVLCCRSAPPSQFVMSAKSTIVLNVLTPTLVGLLFVKYIHSYCFITQRALHGRCAVQRGLLGGLLHERVNLGLKSG